MLPLHHRPTPKAYVRAVHSCGPAAKISQSRGFVSGTLALPPLKMQTAPENPKAVGRSGKTAPSRSLLLSARSRNNSSHIRRMLKPWIAERRQPTSQFVGKQIQTAPESPRPLRQQETGSLPRYVLIIETIRLQIKLLLRRAAPRPTNPPLPLRDILHRRGMDLEGLEPSPVPWQGTVLPRTKA